jgi:hypothetical protein
MTKINRTKQLGNFRRGVNIFVLKRTTPSTSTQEVPAIDFHVSTPSFAFTINATIHPTLTLVRGRTYTFAINNSSTHPFWIKTSAVTGTGSAFTNGVTNNGITSGTLTFAVPTDAPNTLFYICQNHSSMRGTLSIIS